jgi:hypothetical protein
MTNAIELVESTFVIKSATLRHHLDEHGEPWFVAKDVCDYLELSNPADAYSRVPEEDKGVSTVDTLGGAQQMVIVNEPGLYRIIFMSRKPEAEEFKRWVFRELLPALRKHGYYRMPGRTPSGNGRQGLGRQPFADVLRQRGISQRAAREAMNALELPVPEVPDTKYGNVIYGSARPSRAFAVRASAYLGVPASELFTTEPRD